MEHKLHRKVSKMARKGEIDLDSSLLLAVELKSLKMVRILLDYGANVNVQRANGMTLLPSTFKITKLLLEYGADVNLLDHENENVLFFEMDLQTLQLVLDYGANVNQISHSGDTCFLLDIPLEELKLFFDYGADFTLKKHNGKNILMIAVSRLELDQVKWLLEQEVDVNHLDNEGDSALNIIMRTNEVEIMTQLLQHGAEPNHPDRYGKTPLQVALENYDLVKTRLLLEYGAEGVNEAFMKTYHMKYFGERFQLLFLEYGVDARKITEQRYQQEYQTLLKADMERKMTIFKVIQSIEKSNPLLAEPRLKKSIYGYLKR